MSIRFINQKISDPVRQKLVRWKLLRSEQSKKTRLADPETLEPTTVVLEGEAQQNYFVEAKSWADDLYTNAIISRNRYKMAFFVAMGFSILLAIGIDGLIPMQHLQPLLIHHYEDGRVSVEPTREPYAPTNSAEVESELVRYVVNRESYDPSSYDEQYSLVNLISNHEVANQYRQDQSSDNKTSPITILGDKGDRTVHVDNVVFLDSTLQNKGKLPRTPPHHNLAQVDFTVTDHFKNSAYEKTTALTALVSWDYLGTPSDPENRWRDWNGFTVTRYTITQRNI